MHLADYKSMDQAPLIEFLLSSLVVRTCSYSGSLPQWTANSIEMNGEESNASASVGIDQFCTVLSVITADMSCVLLSQRRIRVSFTRGLSMSSVVAHSCHQESPP